MKKTLFILALLVSAMCIVSCNKDNDFSNEKYKAECEAFLAENAKRDGVKVTNSGLQYEVLKEGEGKTPTATSVVKCHYEGKLLTGETFDSSYQRGEPSTFILNQLIPGWVEGMQLMKEGSKYRFFIPYYLGYGAYGAGTVIPPYSALIFEIELLQVM